MSSYQLVAGMSSYLTTAAASSTYQPMITTSTDISARGVVANGQFSVRNAQGVIVSYIDDDGYAMFDSLAINGTLAGSAFTSLLSPYALTSSLSSYQPLITSTTAIQAGSTTVNGILNVNCIDSVYVPFAIRDSTGVIIYNVGPNGNAVANGAMQGASLISTGQYGLSVMNGAATNARISQAGAISGTSLSVSGTIAATGNITMNGNVVLTSQSLENSPLYVQRLDSTGVITCGALTTNNINGIAVFDTAANKNASITMAGAITGTSLTVNGAAAVTGAITSAGNTVLTTTYNPIFCGGFVNNNGTKGTTIGRVDYTVTSSSTGKYLITYASAYPSSNYMPTVTCWNSSGTSALLGVAGALTNTTRLEVHTFASNVLANTYFYFMVY